MKPDGSETGKNGPSGLTERWTVKVDPMADPFQVTLADRFPGIAWTLNGMPGATVGFSVPVPEPPQAGSSRPSRTNDRIRNNLGCIGVLRAIHLSPEVSF